MKDDDVTQGGEQRLIAHVPGAAGQPHFVFPEASHFLQEDVPDELVDTLRLIVPAPDSAVLRNA